MGVAVRETTMETADGDRERHREFAKQAAHDASHQKQRNEHGQSTKRWMVIR